MENKLNDNYSSKLKRVFIELHNYSFNHGSSIMGEKDERFVGRERLLEKFKSVLTNTSKKSGIYLVTGYRGMGKTSFVNKALEDIYCSSHFLKNMTRWGMLLLSSYLLTLFFIYISRLDSDHIGVINYVSTALLFYLAILIISFIFYYILKRSIFNVNVNDNDEMIKKVKKIITNIKKSIFERVENENKEKNKIKHLKYIEEIIIISALSALLILIAWLINIFIKADNVYTILANFLFVEFLIMFLILFLYKHSHYKKDGKTKNILPKIISLIFSIIERVKQLINYSSAIHINLNLGHSNLNEINVLRLIVQNIQNEFENHQKQSSLNKFFKILVFVVIFCLVNKFNYHPSIQKFNSSFRNSIGLTQYFPSQNNEFLDNNQPILENIMDTLHKYNRISSENYFIYVHTLTTEGRLSPQYIKDAFRYLSYFDKTLVDFLDIDRMEGFSDTMFYHEYNRKLKAFFECQYLKYDSLTKRINLKNSSQFDGLALLHPIEISQVLKYYQDNKTISIEGREVNLFFLYRLKKLNDLYKQYNSMSGFQKLTITSANYVDYFIYLGYFHIRHFLPFINNGKSNKTILIPQQIDYLFILYIVIFYFIFKIVNRLLNYNRPTLKGVKRKLIFINELIDSSLTIEKSGEVKPSNIPFSLSQKKSRSYTKADAREIEKFIIEIINDIGRLPINSFRSEFIFVFDELDKIDPQVEKEDRNNNSVKAPIYSPEGIRYRQQAVMALLSNLKFFLSTAQAKFIFIAGREMFDAALADVSDRNFRIGSIFHDIFYLNSFYSDLSPLNIEEITSRTEQYVCQFLFPTTGSEERATLKYYNKYLKNNFSQFNEDDASNNDIYKKIIARQKREKIIYLLQQFIVYLNHQSAGAPSKITSYFENYVINKEMFRSKSSEISEYSIHVEKKKSDNLFLFFDYYDQYELGLINYLITPFNYTINKSIRNYGDKLIVSASFLHNHIFKFHRNAFSWRDLEATPEMVDINKNPELRDFLSQLMEFMLKTHVQNVINGIYDFKFPKRISQELLFLSHVSEEASASFNFTLDESLIVKQHYREQLLRLRENYPSDEKNKDNYIYSVSSINLTIADLCFYDGDYGEAILYYLEAIQQFRNKPVSELSITQLSLLTRDMLKLGYALEKRKTYDSAHMTYSEITDIIIRKIAVSNINRDNIDFLKSMLNNINYLYQPLLAKLYLIEKNSPDGIKISDLNRIYKEYDQLTIVFDLFDNYEDKYKEGKGEHFDKLNARGIVNNNDKYMIESEFWNKIGNLLYYKNCVIGEENYCPYIKKNENMGTCKSCSACRKYIDSLNIILLKYGIELVKPDTKSYTSIYNLKDFVYLIKYLMIVNTEKSIRNIEYRFIAMLLSNYGNIQLSCAKDEVIDIHFITRIFKYISSETKLHELYINPENKLEIMMFSYLCSSFFYRLSNDHRSASNQYTNILYFFKEYTSNNIIDENLKVPIEDFVIKIVDCAIKDIYCSYDYIHNYEINKFKKIFDVEGTLIAKDIALKRGSINTDLDEINIITERIKLNLFPNVEPSNTELFNIYNLVSPYYINSNMYNRILKLQLRAKINEMLFNGKIGTFEYETKDYSKIITSISKNLDNKIVFFDKTPNFIELLEFLISDSIFCYFEILKLCNTFDKSFSLNYSLLAESHSKLGLWCDYLSAYLLFQTVIEKIKVETDENIVAYIKEYLKNEFVSMLVLPDNILKNSIDSIRNTNYFKSFSKEKCSIVENIEGLIEPDNMHFISPIYQCEKAINAYYAMQYTHQQGQAYKNLIDNMYYLNDDFNDDLYHFSVALERYKINKGNIETEIKKLKDRSRTSDLYKHENYIDEIIK
jgi:hypothetical protein